MPKGAGSRARRQKARPALHVRRRIFNIVMERDQGLCWICGDPVVPNAPQTHPLGATLDHVVPHAEGGRWAANNLRLAHRACNEERGTARAA